jgi:hypothetical protein
MEAVYSNPKSTEVVDTVLIANEQESNPLGKVADV